MANAKKGNKGKIKTIIIFSVIGLALIGSFIIAISGKGGPGGIGQGTNPTPSASPSASPSVTPLPQSTTPAQTAKEAFNVPTTPEEKTYYACLLNRDTLNSSKCKAAEKVVSKEVNIFGSNMATKFQYQVTQQKIEAVRESLIDGINSNKIVVDGIDYFKKSGIFDFSSKGSILNASNGKSASLEGLQVFLYDSPQTYKDFCISATSPDGKVTWKVKLSTPNIILGPTCSPTSL